MWNAESMASDRGKTADVEGRRVAYHDVVLGKGLPAAVQHLCQRRLAHRPVPHQHHLTPQDRLR